MAAAIVSSVGVEVATKEEKESDSSSSYIRRWEAFRERRTDAYEKISRRAAVRKRLSELSPQERMVHRSMPLELLAREWLNEQRASIENRAYLVDKVLPTLVIGVEKLLDEVSLRSLEEADRHNPDFNPVNYLAQYLMRNNPRYSNFAEAHPYCRSMKEVAEELKRLAFSMDENRLAQLKAHSRQRRAEREKQGALRAQEEERRTLALRAVFSRWTLPGEADLPLLQVQQAVRSWLEAMKEHALAATLKESFSNLLQAEDISDKLLREKDFVAEVMGCTSELPVDVFDVLVEHLEMCGAERRKSKTKGERRELFNGVFSDCDPGKTGFVDRLRVVHLFGGFYDSASPGDQRQLHNPRKWPVVELIEDEEWEDGEREGEGLEGSPTPLSEQDYQEFLTGSALETTPTPAGPEEKDEKAATEPAKPVEASDGTVASPEAQQSQPQGGGSLTEPESEGEPGSKGSTAERPNKDGGGDLEQQPVAGHKEAVKLPGEEAGGGSRPTASSRGRSSISKSRQLSGMSSRPVTPSGPGSVWDHRLLREAQFVQLVELFLGEEPHSVLVGSLAAFLRESYCETERERAERLEQAQLQMVATARRHRANSLFDVWDNDRSGYLEMEELQLVLSKWKGFSSEMAQQQAKEILSSLGAMQGRLTRQQFHSYFQQLTEGMSLEGFGEFADYLMTSVKLTFEELRRGEKRRGFLSKITLAGKTSGLQFMEALKAATAVLQQDGSEFGSGKQCSIALSLLEPSSSTSEPRPCLQFKAASSDCQDCVVGCKLLHSYKQVSYQAVEAGRPVHVPNIKKHGGVFFFCPDHKTEEFNGSLVVAPIATPQRQVVGTLSVDTLTDSKGLETSFKTHEVNFYEGVGGCLGEVFHWMGSLRKLLRVARSALGWVHRRCPQVLWAEVYVTEPALSEEEQDGYALRLMLATTSSSPSSTQAAGERLRKKDNLFKEYLFQCVEQSEPVSGSAYGHHHLAFPVRDHTGCAVAVVDLCMPSTHSLPPQQAREVTRVLKLLTVAYRWLSQVPETRERKEGEEGEEGSVPALSGSAGGEEDMSVLFDQLMLADLRESMARLDNRVFAELRSYVDPPEVVLHTLQALLLILHPQQEFSTWAQCRQYVTLALVKALESYNPLAQRQHPRLSQVRDLLQGIPASSVTQHSSLPTMYIHSWVSVCVSLLEHASSPAGTTPLVSDSQSSSESSRATEPASS